MAVSRIPNRAPRTCHRWPYPTRLLKAHARRGHQSEPNRARRIAVGPLVWRTTMMLWRQSRWRQRLPCRRMPTSSQTTVCRHMVGRRGSGRPHVPDARRSCCRRCSGGGKPDIGGGDGHRKGGPQLGWTTKHTATETLSASAQPPSGRRCPRLAASSDQPRDHRFRWRCSPQSVGSAAIALFGPKLH
jgi:hypothetical protein